MTHPLARPVDRLITPHDADASASAASSSPWMIAISRLRRDRMAIGALVILVTIVALVLATPLVEEHWSGRAHDQQDLSATVTLSGEPVEVVDSWGTPQVGPGLRREFTLGADPLGRDVLTRVLAGGRVSLIIGVSAALITTIIATLLGLYAGYMGGRVDMLISRYFDIQWAFPTLVLAIALSTALASSEGFLFIRRGSIMLPICIIALVMVPYLGRVVRGQVMALRNVEHVEASRALGARRWRTLTCDILPNIAPTILTYFALLTSLNIIAEAGLSFLGVGVLAPTPSWGNMIADGRIFYASAWWVSLFPGLMIMLTLLALNLLAQSAEEALDPKGADR